MSFQILEKHNLLYLAYYRASFKDFADFREALINSCLKKSSTGDIVIDLTACESLTNDELTLLANAARELHGSPRHLRIAAGRQIRGELASNSMLLACNAGIYESCDMLLKRLGQDRLEAGGRKKT